MSLARHKPSPPRPESSDFVSLVERMNYMLFLRGGFACVVLATAALASGVVGSSFVDLVWVTGPYLLVSAAVEGIRRIREGRRLILVGGMLLIDGVYLSWVMYSTGGTQSPLRFLVFVHLIAVTLLASYRTGLKIALWHSLLFFIVFYAQAAGGLEIREAVVTALPGQGTDFASVSMLNVAALWVVALVTATFSALNERELRRQKVDLAGLADMAAELESTDETNASDVPHILLDTLRDGFGFPRGLVLASRDGDPSLMAYRGPGDPAAVQPGLDPVMDTAWASRRTQLVRRLDPDTDPRLASLLPDARNLLVVPLFLRGGYRLGVLVLEHPVKGDRIERWLVSIVEQFAAHAALALHNAWLLEDLQAKLAENEALQAELVSHNATLEARVEERTSELNESLDDLRRVDQQRRRLLSRLVSAEEGERRRIAGDIHDDPLQAITAIGMRLGLLRRYLNDPQQLAEVAQLERSVKQAIFRMRSLLFELTPPVLDREGLAAALRQYLQRAEDETEVEYLLEDRLGKEPPLETRVILYRIAQEALTNVRKHSDAEHVNVALEERDGGFLVRIGDDGQGFSAFGEPRSPAGHMGLSSMRQRADLAGGSCQIESLPGAGTTVECWLPADDPIAVAS